MKKYIFLSLFIHVGIAAALISWSGLSVSEWTQNLLTRFSGEQTKDGLVETQEESVEQIPIENKLPEKKLEIKKKAAQVLKKSQKSKTQSKPAVRKKTRPKTSVKKLTAAESSSEENSNKEITKKEDMKLSEKLKNKDNSLEKKAPSMAQKQLPAEIDSTPEVKYNPAEDLKAVDQESLDPSEVFQKKADDEPEFHNQVEPAGSSLSEAVQSSSESPEDRDFEEINTNPQDLKKIIAESSQKEIKSSQTLIPVPGNPEWSYPQQARQNKKEGSVFLQYFVDDTGFVDKIKLLKSSGYSILDNEALRVMARQKYRPGQSGWYRHQVDFKLKNM